MKRNPESIAHNACENEKKGSPFMRVFYCLSAIPIALLLELCMKSTGAVVCAMSIAMISAALAVICYSWAMFKAFHHPLFAAEGDGLGERRQSPGNFVLARLVQAVLQLAVLMLVLGAAGFLHLRILKTMPEEVMEAELIRQGSLLVEETLGSGIYLAFSAVSLFFQGVVLISITYVSATASHLGFFQRYKTLAGIFAFVLLYVFESDVSAALKKIMARGFGGIQQLMLREPYQAIGILAGIEAAAYLAVVLINIWLTCYCLKRLERGETYGEGEKEEKI